MLFLLFDFRLRFVCRLQFVFINRLLALLLIIINIGLALTYMAYMDSRARGRNKLQVGGLGGIQAKPESGVRFEVGAQIEVEAREKAEEGSGRGSVSPFLGIFSNRYIWCMWKGKSCPKLGVNKNWGSWPLEPTLVALLLEQAIDASFYELTLPKQLNDLGVGSVELQSSLFSSHIWSDEIVICMRKIIILLFYILMFFYYYPILRQCLPKIIFSNAISANMLQDPPIQFSEVRWPGPRWTPCSKKWGVGWPRWPRGSDATARLCHQFNDIRIIIHHCKYICISCLLQQLWQISHPTRKNPTTSRSQPEGLCSNLTSSLNPTRCMKQAAILSTMFVFSRHPHIYRIHILTHEPYWPYIQITHTDPISMIGFQQARIRPTRCYKTLLQCAVVV